jgi:hypothetical protein
MFFPFFLSPKDVESFEYASQTRNEQKLRKWNSDKLIETALQQMSNFVAAGRDSVLFGHGYLYFSRLG